MFVVVLLFASVTADLEPTTTKTYDIEVPGSDPIRIIEGEPLWKTNSEHRSFGTTDSPLQQFLENYADSVRRGKDRGNDVRSIEDESIENAKSWDLLPVQKHHHPYDDQRGWVSMEPVPWSVSKIAKWQSKYKPSNSKPWEDFDSEEVIPAQSWHKSSTNKYDVYHSKPDPKPIYTRPTAVYKQKVHLDYSNKYQHKHDEDCRHPQNPESEIITDGLPSHFPQLQETRRRHGTEMHPETHPFSGDGEWVLLSTTKGYKYPPQKQRSLKLNPDSIGTKRGVQLTVLPPLKNSKVNMTTSHGGLLQVESTFQTVEQSRKQSLKKHRIKKKQNKAKPPRRVQITPTVTTTRKNAAPDSSAVLAAVGAGMIPATMAMLVPMALGGRRKREATADSSTPKYLQITLPRNLY